MHLFGKGAGARGGDRGGQSLIGILSPESVAKSDARRASRARRALRCDLATVLLTSLFLTIYSLSFSLTHTVLSFSF